MSIFRTASKFCKQRANDEELLAKDLRILIEVLDPSGLEKKTLVELNDISGLENYSEFVDCAVQSLSFQVCVLLKFPGIRASQQIYLIKVTPAYFF